MKLSHNPWGTKQSHIVPSCLWSSATTIEALNSLTLSHRVTVSLCPIVFVKLSDNARGTKVSLCPIVFVKSSDIHWGTKQSHFVPWRLGRYLTTLEALNSLILSHRVCQVVWPPLSRFVPSCLWSYLTTIEVLNSLILSHRACEVVIHPLMYY